MAERSDVLNGLQDQVTTKSSLGDCSGRVRITLAANFLYFFYFRPRSELIKSMCTVSTKSWVRIPPRPTFYIKSKNLSSK